MKNNDFRLDIPDDCDYTVTDRITEICPVFDEKEKEKIFAMSERKYNKKKNTSEGNDCEDKVKGVEIYRRPKWYRPLAAVAAFVLVFGGVAGGIALIKKTEIPDADIYSQVETNPQTEALTEEQTNPTAENSFAMLTKEDIYNKMINSVDYYSKASGKIIEYTESSMTGNMIEFETDIDKSKAYCHETEIVLLNPDEAVNGSEVVQGEFLEGYIPFDYITYCDGKSMYDLNETAKEIYNSTTTAVTREISETSVEDGQRKNIDIIKGEVYAYRLDPTNTVFAETCLFPQSTAFNHLSDLSKWEIKGIETYAGRKCAVINSADFGIGCDSMILYVDTETGVLLKYAFYDKAGYLQHCMFTESIAFDEDAADVREVNFDDYEVIE